MISREDFISILSKDLSRRIHIELAADDPLWEDFEEEINDAICFLQDACWRAEDALLEKMVDTIREIALEDEIARAFDDDMLAKLPEESAIRMAVHCRMIRAMNRRMRD